VAGTYTMYVPATLVSVASRCRESLF
jgi:hypothetical protein